MSRTAVPPTPHAELVGIDIDRERRWLESLRRRYHHRRFLSPDPLEVVYGCEDPRDREIVALIASALAYGNVKAMLPAIRTVLDALGSSPATSLQSSMLLLRRRLRDFRYRFTTGAQLASLLNAVSHIIKQHGSLHACFIRQLNNDDVTIINALGCFVDELRRAAPSPLAHLVPHPHAGSACKRLNLFLRWMVRSDEIDPGGWSGVNPGRLIIPLDTHVYRVARARRWTHRRTPDLKTALHITSLLRAIRKNDPLRYDFAITRPGIRREAMPDSRPDGLA